MKYLRRFEAYTIFKDDNPQLTNDKRATNKLDSDIKEFNTKKTTLFNIYNTYKDQNDLLNKLYSQKFIDNIKDKNFKNPLIGLYAELYDKKRQYNDIQSKIDTEKETLTQKNKLATTNPEIETTKDEIASSNEKISDLQKSLSDMNSEIRNMEKATEEKLKRMKQDLDYSTNRIDYELKKNASNNK